jgi:branched-subunit amino acid aminotransferase/4-amino-4-deoxychorismate lyase
MSYVNSVNAWRTPEPAGVNDGLMFDRNEHLAETSAANVFLIERDRRPMLRRKRGMVRGISRQVLGNDVGDVEITHQKSAIIAGAFVGSTPMEGRPILRFGDRQSAAFNMLPFAKHYFSDSHASMAAFK